MDPVQKVLRDSKISKNNVHEIVFVGGSTRIPKVQQLLNLNFLMVKNYVNQLILMKQSHMVQLYRQQFYLVE